MNSGYNLHFDPQAKKFLENINDKKTKQRLFDLIEKIKLNPLLGIKLKGSLSSCYRVRCSNYRIIYKFYAPKKILAILMIDDRKQIYR